MLDMLNLTPGKIYMLSSRGYKMSREIKQRDYDGELGPTDGLMVVWEDKVFVAPQKYMDMLVEFLDAKDKNIAQVIDSLVERGQVEIGNFFKLLYDLMILGGDFCVRPYLDELGPADGLIVVSKDPSTEKETVLQIPKQPLMRLVEVFGVDDEKIAEILDRLWQGIKDEDEDEDEE